MIRAAREALVVLGTGMAGAKVVEEALARDPDRYTIRMFGAEPHGTYNRILLSTYLGGFGDPGRLWLNPLEWYEQRGIIVHAGVKAEKIDLRQRVVVGAGGKVVEPYDCLVIATGSRPFVPPLEGSDQKGVFVFRTLDDCHAIAARAQDCDSAVILGGGPLGLEAARGLLSHDLSVTVVETGPHLMARQLDAAGGELLRHKLEAMGVRVLCGARPAALPGEDGTVCGVRLEDGTVLDADMVVISCGIRPNVEVAREAGLAVERAVVVDDQLRTNDPSAFAVGECAQHRGKVYGLVDPVYEQARVLADVLTGASAQPVYTGSRQATTLKVMGVDLLSMGEVNATGGDCEVVSHLDPANGVYRKLVVRDNRLVGGVLLGAPDANSRLLRLFKDATPLSDPATDLLDPEAEAPGDDVTLWPDSRQICNCNEVPKGRLVQAIRDGKCSVAALGECTKAGTGCGTCQPLLTQLIAAYGPNRGKPPAKNKIELMKEQKDGLDCLPDLLRHAPLNNWAELTEDDKQRAKWHGLFFRKPTPGFFMMRIRFNAGQADSRQLRAIADLSDEYGKGFADLTTRQQIQLRWFTLAEAEKIWQRLHEVGLTTLQTGLDNVRGVCGCPVAGLTPHELFDASPVVHEYTQLIVGNREFTNLPRKFNVTITGCLENCCHAETQDVGLVPAYRELDGRQVNGFNLLVGGKQGSGGYTPATPLDVFTPPEEAARLALEVTAIFRDHGSRGARNRARLAFLIMDRGAKWFRQELERRWGRPLLRAGTDLRKKHHVDHLGINPQKHSPTSGSPPLFYVGMSVPVGRITTAQLRAVADLADRYGSGEVRMTVGQNLVVPNVPESRVGALADEPIFRELPYDPSPIMRGLVACTGNDYCPLALIETKGWAIRVAKELEERTAGRKLQPLTIHWSGCAAGCGMHSVSTIGLQGCRSRVNGQVVDAAHVSIKGRTGPSPAAATDVMYDVPCERLSEVLEPLVSYLPR
jgi:nitrite reductase (NADH) large subunit